MYPKSIFDVPRKKSDLASANQGMSNLYYDEIASTKNVSDVGDTSNFSGGSATWRWFPPSGTWWIPSRSYFRIDCELTRADGTPLKCGDGIAPNMGLGSCLFSKMIYKINDKTISEISENVAQIDALKTRLSKTGQWMNTTGANSNFWQASNSARKEIVAADSVGAIPTGSHMNTQTRTARTTTVAQSVQWQALLNFNAGDTLTFTQFDDAALIPGYESAFIFTDADAGAHRVRFVVDGVVDPALVAAGIEVGKKILWEHANVTYLSTVLRIESAGPASVNGNTLNKIIIDQSRRADIGGALNPANGLYSLTGAIGSNPRRVKKFSIIYQPPLSIFGVNHAIPGSSKHELEMTPFSNTIYQKNAIESLISNKTHGAANDFKFLVTDMLFYAARCDGPVVQQDEFFLDLQECRCSALQIQSNARSQISINISPSTNALSVAFQDELVDTNTIYSQSKFKIRGSQELKLTNFYLRYAGIQKPQPDYRPQYSAGDADPAAIFALARVNRNIDLISEQYIRSILYNGSYFDGSSETLEEWKDRGMYMHWPWPKTGTDRESRAYISTQFDAWTENDLTPRVLLFNHFTKVCILRYQGGQLSEVLINEV